MASFGFLYVRRLYTINPDSVYRKAMLQLNTNPAILEVRLASIAKNPTRVMSYARNTFIRQYSKNTLRA